MTDAQPSLWDIPRQTRRAAKATADETATRNRALLLAAYRAVGPMTADEAGLCCGLLHLQARPRVSQLAKAGLLEPTGDERPSSLGNPMTVYRAVRNGA